MSGIAHGRKEQPMWQPVANAPCDRDLELAVVDRDGPHALVFPCRRVLHGWVKAETRLARGVCHYYDPLRGAVPGFDLDPLTGVQAFK